MNYDIRKDARNRALFIYNHKRRLETVVFFYLRLFAYGEPISHSPKDKQGRQTLNQLVSDGSKLENIEVSDKNIKSFEASARAYGIKFAVKKVPDQQTYAVFFKGKDIEQVNRAFRHYQKNFGRSKAQERPSVLKEINTINREQQQKNKQRERSREQKKERGMEH